MSPPNPLPVIQSNSGFHFSRDASAVPKEDPVMRRSLAATFMVLLGVATLVAFAGGEHAEQAYECNVCEQTMADTMHLKESGNLKFDVVNIENGAILVAFTNPENAAKVHDKCAKAMALLDMEMQKPEAERKLCPYCTAVVKLKMSGVKIEHLPSRHGEVDLIQAENDAQLQAIQEYVLTARKMFAGDGGA